MNNRREYWRVHDIWSCNPLSIYECICIYIGIYTMRELCLERLNLIQPLSPSLSKYICKHIHT